MNAAIEVEEYHLPITSTPSLSVDTNFCIYTYIKGKCHNISVLSEPAFLFQLKKYYKPLIKKKTH
jgi:hypothetical protein